MTLEYEVPGLLSVQLWIECSRKHVTMTPAAVTVSIAIYCSVTAQELFSFSKIQSCLELKVQNKTLPPVNH